MLHYSFLHHVWNSCMQEHCKYLDTVAWNTLLKIIFPKYLKLAERIGSCSHIGFFFQKIYCGYTLEPPREYQNCMFWNKTKTIRYTPANPKWGLRRFILHCRLSVMRKQVHVMNNYLGSLFSFLLRDLNCGYLLEPPPRSIF